jgi:hypothetical protein
MYYVHDVTYDMDTKNDPDYDEVRVELEHMDSLRVFDSTWFVFTTESESELYHRLQPHLKGRDKLRVGEVRTIGTGRLPRGSWEWITNRLAHCRRGPVLKNHLRAQKSRPKDSAR